MYRELYIFVSHAKMIFQTNILELQKGLEIGIQSGVSQIKIELVWKSLKFYGITNIDIPSTRKNVRSHIIEEYKLKIIQKNTKKSTSERKCRFSWNNQIK